MRLSCRQSTSLSYTHATPAQVRTHPPLIFVVPSLSRQRIDPLPERKSFVTNGHVLRDELFPLTCADGVRTELRSYAAENGIVLTGYGSGAEKDTVLLRQLLLEKEFFAKTGSGRMELDEKKVAFCSAGNSLIIERSPIIAAVAARHGAFSLYIERYYLWINTDDPKYILDLPLQAQDST